MEMFQIQCKMRKSELYWELGGILGTYLLGIGIFAALCVGDDEMARAFPVGTLIAVFGTVVAHLVGCIFNMLSAFGLSVSMGATRKQFAASYAVFSLLELILACVFLRVMYGLEKMIYLKTMGLSTYEADWVTAGSSLVAAVCVIAGILSVEMFCGALILKFGAKAAVGIWIFFMAVCYLPINLHRIKGFSDFFAGVWNGGMNPAVMPGILAVFAFVCAVLLLAAWGMLRRQQVS